MEEHEILRSLKKHQKEIDDKKKDSTEKNNNKPLSMINLN